jgi:hypothetical protein
MRIIALVTLLVVLSAGGPGLMADDKAKAGKSISLVVAEKEDPILLKDTDSIATVASFKPPVEITVVAKTDSHNIRLSYAANQVIFNWEMNEKQLRVDGGPANGKHKVGAGTIPTDKFVTIVWRVTPKKQSIFVDNELRFEHEGDYSELNRPVRIFTHKAKISVKSMEVKPLPPEKE